jgi:predicted enzyme related to lactoylglutathione lyase
VSQHEHDKRVDYVEFYAPDLDAVKRFYSGIFGWEFTDYGPEYCAFADGRLNGGFRIGEAHSPEGIPLVVIYAADLVAMEASVREHGGEIVIEPFDFPGGRRFHFADPAGNQLAVWSES